MQIGSYSFDISNLAEDTASISSSKSKNTSTDNSVVQQFLEYGKETPAQQMFSNWLGSQNMTLDQFNALSQSEKDKVLEKYREQLESRYGAGGVSHSASPEISTATSGAFVNTTA